MTLEDLAETIRIEGTSTSTILPSRDTAGIDRAEAFEIMYALAGKTHSSRICVFLLWRHA